MMCTQMWDWFMIYSDKQESTWQNISFAFFNVRKTYWPQHFLHRSKISTLTSAARLKLWFTCSVFEIMLNCRPTSCWNMGGPKQCIFSKTAMSTLNVKHLALWGGQVKVGSASWIGILLALLETWLKKYFKHCKMAAITISRNFIKCKIVAITISRTFIKCKTTAITITVKSLLFVGYQFSWFSWVGWSTKLRIQQTMKHEKQFDIDI